MLMFRGLSLATAIVNQTAAFAYQSVRAIRDPTDADAVSAVGELTSLDALEKMKSAMMSDRVGRSILLDQPLVGDDVLERAKASPEGSFGQRYAAYMSYNHFTPSGRTAVKHISDPTLAYVMTRYRQCHDFLHTACECGRTVEEELAVKLVEWYQTGLPLGVLAIAGGAPHLSGEQRERMKTYNTWASLHQPSAVHGEGHIPFYLNVEWEKLLDKPFAEVSTISGITPLPVYLERIKTPEVLNVIG